MREGRAHALLAVDRVSQPLHAGSLDAVAMADGAAFMARAAEASPYRVHAVLTDDGARLTDQPRCRNGTAASLRLHVFDRVRRRRGIEHGPTRPYRPWTDGQAERMVRTLKEATVKSFHHETRADLEARLRGRVQPRRAPERVGMEDALPGGPRSLGQGPEPPQGRSAPPHRGTVHLVRRRPPNRGRHDGLETTAM